jgi:hypothetical protein
MNMYVQYLTGRRNRSHRNHIKRCLRAGMFVLRVVGSEKDGFRLAAQDGEHLKVFGFVFTKQSQAIEKGIEKYGKKAIKFAPNNAHRQTAAA